jgi:hypothetical protein
MKFILIVVIVISRFSDAGVGITSAEFDTLDSCKKAALYYNNIKLRKRDFSGSISAKCWEK